jgi:glyoxylase-like metal-dependent hydrolase (beta-lactamase superfamily II)
MDPFAGRLTFLGTGTGVPSKDRASPACLLELPAARLLIDLGPGSLRQLARVSLAVPDLDGLLLTHLHPDHSADLAPLLFAGKYRPLWPPGRRCTWRPELDFDFSMKSCRPCTGPGSRGLPAGCNCTCGPRTAFGSRNF